MVEETWLYVGQTATVALFLVFRTRACYRKWFGVRDNLVITRYFFPGRAYLRIDCFHVSSCSLWSCSVGLLLLHLLSLQFTTIAASLGLKSTREKLREDFEEVMLHLLREGVEM